MFRTKSASPGTNTNHHHFSAPPTLNHVGYQNPPETRANLPTHKGQAVTLPRPLAVKGPYDTSTTINYGKRIICQTTHTQKFTGMAATLQQELCEEITTHPLCKDKRHTRYTFDITAVYPNLVGRVEASYLPYGSSHTRHTFIGTRKFPFPTLRHLLPSIPSPTRHNHNFVARASIGTRLLRD